MGVREFIRSRMASRARSILRAILLSIGVTAVLIGAAHVQVDPDAPTAALDHIACQSIARARQLCPADTSSGFDVVIR
jgi:hypothetical protein